MKILIQFAVGCFLAPLIDYIWLGKVMKGLYHSEMGHLMRLENGELQLLVGPAAAVYLLINAGLLIFALPPAQGHLGQSFLYGACFGLVAYGIYDMTNLATLQNWSLKLSLVDMTWGGLLCGIIALAMAWVGQRLS